MIKYLLDRPIAVLMTFTACIIIGLTTYFTLPVSLLPDIAIPEITVQVKAENSSARELENNVIKHLRRQLMQVGKLQELKSECRDGNGLIHLRFDFGTNTNLAFIEVNEKIDAAMNSLPRDISRPQVIKASATDIPVFYLNLTLKSNTAFNTPDEERFLELSNFAETVIKRRIEQLPEVSMVDITGLTSKQVQIIPDNRMMESLGLTFQDLETVLLNNNVEPGSMIVRDGYYEYNIKFSTLLRTVEDIQNIFIQHHGRILQLKDIATIKLSPKPIQGYSIANGKQAVTLAIIKQANENMSNLKKSLNEVTTYFEKNFPDIEFTINRNQTELLDYTMSNLKQNLGIGFILICIVALLFLGDAKSPMIIGITMISSLITSFMFFYFFGKSLNIISISGLILALGMMIDSSIIVTENISQYKKKGHSIDEACILGTTEVITPMLSSTLTTIAVFLPLIFLSGIAGAIFIDEAFAVTVGLMVSYFTGIMLLPVLYKIFYKTQFIKKDIGGILAKEQQYADRNLYSFYNHGINYVFKHKSLNLIIILLALPLCGAMFLIINKSRMPKIDQVEMLVNIEWNENINIIENNKRITSLFKSLKTPFNESAGYIGKQQYLLNKGDDLGSSECQLYFKTENKHAVKELSNEIAQYLQSNYSNAVFSFAPPTSVFEQIFVTGEAEIVTELYPRNRAKAPSPAQLKKISNELKEHTGCVSKNIPFNNQYSIQIDREKLLLYHVNYEQIYNRLKNAFKSNQITTLRSYQQFLPIILSEKEKSLDEIMAYSMVTAQNPATGETTKIPLSTFITITPNEDVKSITAGRNGEYYPLVYSEVKSPKKLINDTKELLRSNLDWEATFSGSFFSNKQMVKELLIVLIISLSLMYFILASQFESFMQPLIVLVEIPVDIGFTLLLLWLTGNTLNLMSLIGIVITAGIVINDSILKIDMINELRKTGVPLIKAIHTAGERRLRAIVMTSLTTILSMVPILFTFDLGSELQKPLALAMIIAMIVGTLVSLFLIPLVYWAIYRKQDEDPHKAFVEINERG